MKREKINYIIDNAILIFLAIQILSVYFSIAASSVAFGLWAGLWIIQLASTRKFNLNKDIKSEIKYFSIFLFLFLVIEILSRIFAIFPDGALITLKSYLLLMIFYVSIAKVINMKILNRILLSVLIIASIISVYELIHYFMDLKEMGNVINIVIDRIDILGYPTSMGEIKMLLILSVFPLLFAKEKFFISKMYLLLILIPIFVSMYLTQSRNVFVAVFISFIVYGLFMNKRFLMIFAGALVILWFIIPARFQDRITSIADPGYVSNESRLIMWNVGLQMFRDHPFLGIGDNEITKVYKTYKEPQISGEGAHLHNNYLMILATTGIFGFIFFISFFVALFIKQIKFYRNVTYEIDKLLIFGSILMMISFHISGFFEWNFGDWKVLTVLLFLSSIPFIIYNFNFNIKKE